MTDKNKNPEPLDIYQCIVTHSEPEGLAAESYRTLRTSLSRDLASGLRSIMIVSTRSGEGKTMVATNFAVALTQLFMDVVLIDGDIRKPTVTKLFDLGGHTGLTNFLEEGGEIKDLLVKTKIERLHILPAGTSTSNAANLLGRNNMIEAFDQLRKLDYCVVIDTPPLTACSDALLIGTQIDGAIMIINPKTWKGEPEARVREQLTNHGIEILGAVLNGSEGALQGEGGQSYGYGYGYGQGYGYGHRGGGKNPPPPPGTEANPSPGILGKIKKILGG